MNAYSTQKSGRRGDRRPSSDEEQQQHFSGKRIAVAAEVFDAVSQLDDGLRDKSKRSYVTQLKHYVKVSALKQLHAALQKEYKKACNRAKITEMPDLLRITVYNSAYKTLMKLVSGGDKIRFLSLLLWSGVARGDSARQCKLHGISAKLVTSIGPSACVRFVMSYRSGKTTVAGSLDHISFVRHFDICMCPAHALGVYFFQRFSVAQETLCPDNSNSFLQVPLISGHQCLQSMQYDAMNTALRRLFKEHGFDPSSITHAFRKGGAVELAQAGVDSGQLRSHCNWGKLDVAESHYLGTAACMEPIMAMGGWDYTHQNRKSAFWHPRFEIFLAYAWLLIAAAHIFGSLPELQQAAAKLVPSQPPKKQANKQAGFAKKLKACYETVSEAILAITEVLCQDSIWLHLTNPERSNCCTASCCVDDLVG
ncbi:hypothetical protein QJQ45_012287 [Haematococcus lacustris]|nr:hypothetical protein QJQ45_012287 [Haematococcus lacustris]